MGNLQRDISGCCYEMLDEQLKFEKEHEIHGFLNPIAKNKLHSKSPEATINNFQNKKLVIIG